jgi:hypothetical protein
MLVVNVKLYHSVTGEPATAALNLWSWVTSQVDMNPPQLTPIVPIRAGSAIPRSIIASIPDR